MKLHSILLSLLCAVQISITATENISVPGLYVFGGDVIDSLNNPGTTLIHISADHVTIDLSGHLMYQDGISSDTTSIGILIDPGLIDVTIKNGIIGPINGTGIIISPGCYDIVFSNVTVNDCVAGGVAALGTPTEPIDGITFSKSSCLSSGTLGNSFVAGFYAQNTQNIFAEDCYFSRNNGGNEPGYGVYCTACSTLDFAECRMGNNRGSSAAGVYFSNVTDARLDKCTMLRNGTSSNNSDSFGYGILIENSNSIMMLNSTLAASYSINGIASNIVSRASSNIGFLNCMSIAATGNSFAAGFSISNGSACAIINSIVQGTRAISGPAYGIQYNDISAGYLRSNTVLNTVGNPAYGIIDTTVPSTSLIAENYAFNNFTNYLVTYTDTITLPVVDGGFSGLTSLPSNAGGMLDNVSINYQDPSSNEN